MSQNDNLNGTLPISGMYENWFLDYASYVILERAVPSIYDGLKPVQRRILHAMKIMDDGRFHKVANIIGQTMMYHPHGDAAIGDALVNMGQKNLLIECQGNWGDTRTGDPAAASRYIEARLSKFALHVAFNSKTTHWSASYDGRNKEPINLPMKFPMVLAMGVEGIAVGLATKILPHNFIELCEASIAHLRKEEFVLYPDFANGGTIDVSNYNEGLKGGKIRQRVTIEIKDKKTLQIKDVPYGTTTGSLIDSILKANDRGKLKVKKVIDNTAKDVEIEIELPNGVSPERTVDALYAFTDCESSISPNSCVIIDDRPYFLSVHEILRRCTDHTVGLLKRELEIKLNELEEKWHMSSLEKIFIENRIYRDIEECTTWESVIETIDKGLDPFKHLLFREVTEDDIVRLTEIKIKRISKYDSFKADEALKLLEEQMAETKHHLANLVTYAIDYYQDLINKFGEGRERKCAITNFDTIKIQQVAAANAKLYVNRADGFIGTGIKKDEFVKECSDIDDVIVIRKDGKFLVTKIDDKKFVGKDILHVDIWKKGDERTVYHFIYADPVDQRNYVKRFNVKAITRDREYDITKGNANSKVNYFSANPNSETEIIAVTLSNNCKAKNKEFDFNFADLAIKGRASQGNVLTKYPVRKIVRKALGSSSLGGRKVWYDETVGRLNYEERGVLLGEFDTEDAILVIQTDGTYTLTNFDLSNRYEPKKIVAIEKFNKDQVITAVHWDAEKEAYFVKRFLIETSKIGQPYSFIGDADGCKLVVAATHNQPEMQYTYYKTSSDKQEMTIKLDDFIDVKGWKAMGNKLGDKKMKNMTLLEPKPDAQDDKPVQTGDTIEWDIDNKPEDSDQSTLF